MSKSSEYQFVLHLCSTLWPNQLMVPAIEAGRALGIAAQTVHNHSRNQLFPIPEIPLRPVGARLYVAVADVAAYLMTRGENCTPCPVDSLADERIKVKKQLPNANGRPRGRPRNNVTEPRVTSNKEVI